MADHLPIVQILRKPPDGPPVSREARNASATEWPAVIERLRRYSTRAPRTSDRECEFCGAGIDADHGHLADIPRQAILCVCRPCYLLFTHDGAGGARFRAVPTRYELLLPQFSAAHENWESLDIPIGLAFFFRSSATNRVTAFYPSPAGATESTLTLETWTALEQAVPRLAAMAVDVEALLVRRTPADAVALIVPIDVCYELVGLIRVVWRGLQGGDDVQRGIDEFFARAIERARSGGG